MMGQKRGSASHFSHWNFLAVMKQIQSESKVILFLFSFAECPVASGLRSRSGYFGGVGKAKENQSSQYHCMNPLD